QQRDAAQKANDSARTALSMLTNAIEEATKNAEEARKNAVEAARQTAVADRARDEQMQQKEQYQRDLDRLSKRIEKASLPELARIQREIKEKAGESSLTPPRGVGGAVPPPPGD